MKNNFLVVLAASFTSIATMICILMFSSCTSCHNRPVPVIPDASTTLDAGNVEDAGLEDAAPPTPVESKKTISKDSWELSVPFQMQITFSTEKDIALTGLLEEPVSVVLVLATEPFPGSYDEYVIHSMRGIRATGAEIVSNRDLYSNAQKFLEIEASKDKVTILNWVTTKNNFAYGLSCGGTTDDPLVEDICLEVFSSFKIK